MSRFPSSSTEKLLSVSSIPKVGIITALPKEYAAVRVLLKNSKKYQSPGKGAGRRYLLGELPAKDGGKHIVVLALADVGNNLASSRASQLIEHFPSVESIIMVGIAGGVPFPSKPDEHVRLGDIVVSNQQGVIQYDMTKETITELVHRYPPRPPSAILWEGVKLLSASEINGKRPWINMIKQTLKKWRINRPLDNSDLLASTEDPKIIVPHPEDPKRVPGQPRVFMGTIASANILLKNPYKRDQLRDKFLVKAIEMEGSGIADATWNLDVGYLVVRGICDYCDINKGDDWQQYAAVVAAAYCCVLIESLPVQTDSATAHPPSIVTNKPEKNIVKTPEQEKTKRQINRRYTIIETLGEGRFGVVSRAYDKNINSYVAIKEIKFTGYPNEEREEFSKRFIREADTLSRLTHPNIAKVLDFGKVGKSLYLITTYFPGGTLESRLGNAIPFNNAAGLLVPIAKALAYSHSEGFIHRDVKPSNILFTDTGEPILSDFGLVKSLRDDYLGLTSEVGVFIGTPSYAAPEQWEGHILFQSDIYALGVIFYEMITGQNPLRMKSLAQRLMNPYLDRPSLYLADLPDIVDQVILRATAGQVADRYETMDRFVIELKKLAIQNIPVEIVSSKIYTNDERESIPLNNVDIGGQKIRNEDEELSSLVEKFEQDINELIVQKDIANAKRLLEIISRLGSEGKLASERLQDQNSL